VKNATQVWAAEVLEVLADRSGDIRWTKVSLDDLLRWTHPDYTAQEVADEFEAQGVELHHVSTNL
jgi:hypothetical protein